ncbi:unnamed protein product [Prorocentrum cordatum]|uniref:Uncharacterized protein n=1 Tax=Prorocentrum cordatum TaxID=2364126 RepID=A0ABN9U4P6_9DINO|nr:unnamed protein product [Polarella glacialis]
MGPAPQRAKRRASQGRPGAGQRKSAPRRGLLGLKVKEKWLQRMRGLLRNGERFKPKRVEVRVFHPGAKKFLPRDARFKPGNRFFLLCNGAVWGSALLSRVQEYATVKEFDADAARHHVTPITAPGNGDTSYRRIKGLLRQRGRLFGWQLAAFRWHAPGRRPKAGRCFRGDNGMVRVPDFSGQEKGQVWFNGGTLPAALEPCQ